VFLPDFVLRTTQNLVTDFLDPDTPDHCQDKKYFETYSYPVSYCYNSRGFRDKEWPEDLSSAVWCFGDSFTVGIGSPLEHTWPWILQQHLGQRVVNISLHGASNNWMARRSLQIIQQINPVRCVFHWSYLHRREKEEAQARNELWQTFYKNIKDPSWPQCHNYWDLHLLPEHIQKEIELDFENSWRQVYDDYRRLHFCTSTDGEDVDNTLQCINSVIAQAPNSIHSFIPDFADKKSKVLLEQQLTQKNICWIPEFPVIDWARDSIHYDKKTAEFLVSRILEHW
jgi:hypothetical protein